MFYIEKNGMKLNIDLFREYITLKAQQITFDVTNRVFIFEEIPKGPCNYAEIEEKMSSSSAISKDFLLQLIEARALYCLKDPESIEIAGNMYTGKG